MDKVCTCCLVSILTTSLNNVNAVYGKAYLKLHLFLVYLCQVVTNYLKTACQTLCTELDEIINTLKTNHEACVAYRKQQFDKGISKMCSGLSQIFIVNCQMPAEQSECLRLVKACITSCRDHLPIIKAYSLYSQVAESSLKPPRAHNEDVLINYRKSLLPINPSRH